MPAPPSPLPRRAGLDAARVPMPQDADYRTVREFLHTRLHSTSTETIDRMLDDGRFVGLSGPYDRTTRYQPGRWVWFHRDLPEEVTVPFDLPVLYRDSRLLVIDKPHFVASIPRGRHIMQSALVRLRAQHDLPELSAAHRLDRDTAGVLMFVIHRGDRGAYQGLFERRAVRKSYRAVVALPAGAALPAERNSRIVKDRGVIRAYEAKGPINARTGIELVAHRSDPDRALVALSPHTGRTHQLRLHLAALGAPILGDDFYATADGEPRERAADDFSAPLQLLADTLEFTDPFTREPQRFVSGRTLQAWDDPDGWSGPLRA